VDLRGGVKGLMSVSDTVPLYSGSLESIPDILYASNIHAAVRDQVRFYTVDGFNNTNDCSGRKMKRYFSPSHS
jgi:hypothetical protein